MVADAGVDLPVDLAGVGRGGFDEHSFAVVDLLGGVVIEPTEEKSAVGPDPSLGNGVVNEADAIDHGTDVSRIIHFPRRSLGGSAASELQPIGFPAGVEPQGRIAPVSAGPPAIAVDPRQVQVPPCGDDRLVKNAPAAGRTVDSFQETPLAPFPSVAADRTGHLQRRQLGHVGPIVDGHAVGSDLARHKAATAHPSGLSLPWSIGQSMRMLKSGCNSQPNSRDVFAMAGGFSVKRTSSADIFPSPLRSDQASQSLGPSS